MASSDNKSTIETKSEDTKRCPSCTRSLHRVRMDHGTLVSYECYVTRCASCVTRICKSNTFSEVGCSFGCDRCNLRFCAYCLHDYNRDPGKMYCSLCLEIVTRKAVV
jgi:hypothetical protein